MKRVLVVICTLVTAIALAACIGISSAATNTTWAVPDENGWNQHLELGGNPYGSDLQWETYEDGFSETFIRAAAAQSYCRAIDITKPFKFEYALMIENNQTVFGFGSSYKDCFVSTVKTPGEEVSLGDQTFDCNMTNFKLAWKTWTGSTGKSIFKGTETWAVSGLTGLVSNPDYELNDVVSYEIYIGTGAENDTSYIKLLGITGKTGLYAYPMTLSLTRDDFKRTDAVDVDGTVFNNDGTKAFFAQIAPQQDSKTKKRITQSFAISTNVQEGYSISDLPKYTYSGESISFKVTGANAQVSLIKKDGSITNLAVDAEGNYKFTMPDGGINEIKVVAADYKVNFKDGDTVLSTQLVKSGAKASPLENEPTKVGFVFQGWYTDAACTTLYDFDTVVTANTDLFAKWAEGVVISFVDSEDDTNVYSTTTIISGESLKMPEAATKAGKSFLGWFYDENGDLEYNAEKTYTENTTVYAVWGLKITYKVRGFNDFVGSTMKTNTTFTAPEMKTVLKSKSIDSAYIVWYTDANYTQEFDFANGTFDADATLYGRIYDNEKSYAKPDVNGWDQNSGKIMDADGTTLTTEQYGAVGGIDSTVDGYSVFNLNNAGMIVNAQKLDVTRPISFEYSARIVDNVVEWMALVLTDTLSGSYLSGGSDSATNNNGTMFTFIHHTATQEGATAPALQASKNCSGVPGITDLGTVNYKVAPNDAARKADFDGFMNTAMIYIGETAADSYVTLNGVKILNLNCKRSDFKDGTAYFTLSAFRSTVFCVRLSQNFNVTVNGSEGFENNVELDRSNANYGDLVKLTIDCKKNDVTYRVASIKVNDKQIDNPTLTKGEDGKYTYTLNMPFEDTEIAVTFEDFYYRAVFNLVYTTDLYKTENIQLGGKLTKPADPARNGYVFEGWFTDEKLTVAYNFDEVLTGDVTLFAKWAKITYTCTFMSDGTSVGTTKVVGLNGKFTKIEDPIKEGYTFEGWYTDAEFKSMYSFNSIVKDDITLYAKWTKNVVEKKGCNSIMSLQGAIFSFVMLGSAAFVLGKKKFN